MLRERLQWYLLLVVATVAATWLERRVNLQLVEIQDLDMEQATNKNLSNSNSTKCRRLEFLHIPKTGGTAVEQAAGKAGIVWGACHFVLPSSQKRHREQWRGLCPHDLHVPNRSDWPPFSNMIPWWHMPSHYIDAKIAASQLPFSPYHLLPQQQSQSQQQENNCTKTIHYFVIIRNPYDRALSEYYYHTKLQGRRHWNDASRMNRWIRQQLDKVQRLEEARNKTHGYSFSAGGHWIPQHDYLVLPATTTNKTTTTTTTIAVLLYERLAEEFPRLMKAYGLEQKVVLPPKDPTRQRGWKGAHNNNNNNNNNRTLGVRDMWRSTRRALETRFAKDFELGNYSLYQTGS